MATQAQRRAQAIQALRALRRHYRATDTQGEKVERELDRLINRKRLVQDESLEKVGQQIDEYAVLINGLINAYVDTVNIIIAIPV